MATLLVVVVPVLSPKVQTYFSIGTVVGTSDTVNVKIVLVVPLVGEAVNVTLKGMTETNAGFGRSAPNIRPDHLDLKLAIIGIGVHYGRFRGNRAQISSECPSPKSIETSFIANASSGLDGEGCGLPNKDRGGRR